MQAQQQSSVQLIEKLALTCASAIAAETVTYPVDIVKTRLQLVEGVRPRGALATAWSMLRHEGLRGLYAGLQPALVRHVFYTTTRITVYEQLRGAYAAVAAGGQHGSSDSAGGSSAPHTHHQQQQHVAHVGLGAKLVIGLTAGAVGQLVAVPAGESKQRGSSHGSTN